MQQKTSILPSTHPVRSLAGLARQIALPHEFAPERFPSFPALERTAVMGFNVPSTWDLPAASTVKAILTRQATFPFWFEKSTSGATFRVTWRFPRAPGSNTTAYDPVINAAGTGNVAQTINQVGVTNGNNGGIASYPILGLDGMGTCPYMYIPDNWTALMVVSLDVAPATAIDCTVIYERWNSPGQASVNSVVAGSTIAGNAGCSIPISMPSSESTWIRIVSVSLSTSTAIALGATNVTVVASSGTLAYTPGVLAGNVQVTPAATVALLPGAYPVEFANSQLPWYSTRTTAAAVLCTNVSQVLNKGGTVLAGRIAPQVVNPWNVSETYINGLHPAEKAFLPLETGLYSYCPPSTDLVDFWDYTLNSTPFFTLPATPLYRLDNTSLVNVMFVTASAVAETLAVNVDWHIEFRTSSSLFPIGLSAVTLETLHQAQLALVSAGFFFENPEHKSVLSKVMTAVKRYGPTALGAVNPAAGRVARTMIQLSSKPASRMKPTSASASGFNGNKKPPRPTPKKGKATSGKKKK
ncbi:hypothetical protein [Wenzhou yanvirus-like virus 1]|uniref:hypothetical protein n=1 Tax=Wenzhou yanvirus-like virus 1 TaxID=1923683 RepID=UPI00090A894E|nr:hypothetical protein [Wenzhou yanvirus-like virus 1]APG78138.1 hypothetical protein [Wenzhou yanvirus-like virus 1]